MKWRVLLTPNPAYVVNSVVVEADKLYVSPSNALQFLNKIAPSDEAKPETETKFIKGAGFRKFKKGPRAVLVSVRGFNSSAWVEYAIKE